MTVVDRISPAGMATEILNGIGVAEVAVEPHIWLFVALAYSWYCRVLLPLLRRRGLAWAPPVPVLRFRHITMFALGDRMRPRIPVLVQDHPTEPLTLTVPVVKSTVPN